MLLRLKNQINSYEVSYYLALIQCTISNIKQRIDYLNMVVRIEMFTLIAIETIIELVHALGKKINI